MKKLIVIFYISSCIGQVLPTIPENIFRVTLSNYSSTSQLELNNQEFNIQEDVTGEYFAKYLTIFEDKMISWWDLAFLISLFILMEISYDYSTINNVKIVLKHCNLQTYLQESVK